MDRFRINQSKKNVKLDQIRFFQVSNPNCNGLSKKFFSTTKNFIITPILSLMVKKKSVWPRTRKKTLFHYIKSKIIWFNQWSVFFSFLTIMLKQNFWSKNWTDQLCTHTQWHLTGNTWEIVLFIDQIIFFLCEKKICSIYITIIIIIWRLLPYIRFATPNVGY